MMKSETTLQVEAMDLLVQKFGDIDACWYTVLLKRNSSDKATLQSEATDWLTQKLGKSETDRFIRITKADKFNYTEWRRENLCPGKTIEEIYNMAAAHAQTLRGEEAQAKATPKAQRVAKSEPVKVPRRKFTVAAAPTPTPKFREAHG